MFVINLSLDETHVLLKGFKYVFHDDLPFKMKVSMNDEGLIIKLNSTIESVMLFPYDKNKTVEVTSDDSIALHDGMNWKQIFQPLTPAKLLK